MNTKKNQTLIWVLIAALWIACIVLGTIGNFVLAMCLGVVLMFLHMMLGMSKSGKLSKKFLIYPMVIWAVLWIVSFILSGHYATAFAGVMPREALNK